MKNSIIVKNINKNYKKNQILKDVSFEVKEGKVTAFLGPNGAGKSTTIKIILGLEKANSGSAKINEKFYSEIKRPLTIVGASFDGVGAPNNITVRQYLKIITASNGILKTRIKEVLEITELDNKGKSLIGELSLGEGQRLGIATALLGNPQFLILDEPTNGLEPRGIRWFREFIREEAKKGKNILLSSHILSEVEAVTDDVVVINKGSIVLKGSIKDVKSDLSSLEELFFKLTEGEI